MNTPLNGMLGLCARAGKLVSGRVPCDISLNKGRARLILVDESAAEATLEYWRLACERRDVPIKMAADIGEAIGKPGRVVLAIEDTAFAKKIQAMF